MKRTLIAGALALCSVAAPAQTVPTGDPAALAAALGSMGYKPGAIDPNDGLPLFHVSFNEFDTVFVFGGCTDGKDCKYLALVSRFTDLKNPPASWANARNEGLDLGKVWTGADGSLNFSLPVPSGGQPLPVVTIRYILDQWTALVGALSQSAIAEKLVK